MKILCVLAAAFLTPHNAGALNEGFDLRASAGVETVFSWRSQRCADDFIPDSPARALRRSDGSIVVIAAHFRNSILKGRTFDSLKPDCQTASRGHEMSDPSAFDDRFWVQAWTRAPDGKIIAVVSHEYQGKRHPGRCLNADRPGPQCWYSSLLLAQGSENDLQFSLLPIPQRILAAPTKPFDPSRLGRYGFFTTTTIVREGGYLYLMAWSEMDKAQGNCLFRTEASNPTGPWLALRDGSFRQPFPSPYLQGSGDVRCDKIGSDSLGIMRSVVRFEKHRTFVGVFSIATDSRRTPGIYYATSQDLIAWSEPKMLFSGIPWYGTRACGEFFDYPSLIDHASTSAEFDTGGSDLYLYLTRYNWHDCNTGLNRDLVRMPIEVVAKP